MLLRLVTSLAEPTRLHSLLERLKRDNTSLSAVREAHVMQQQAIAHVSRLRNDFDLYRDVVTPLSGALTQVRGGLLSINLL